LGWVGTILGRHDGYRRPMGMDDSSCLPGLYSTAGLCLSDATRSHLSSATLSDKDGDKSSTYQRILPSSSLPLPLLIDNQPIFTTPSPSHLLTMVASRLISRVAPRQALQNLRKPVSHPSSTVIHAISLANIHLQS
jgi:hypothetical protein